MKQPMNETETHYMLKEIAKYILWSWGYTKLGTEVGSMYSIDGIGRNPKRDMKNIIDAVGVKKTRDRASKSTYSTYCYDVKGIEAKASLSDFRNGFCAAPAYTYIIAPKGVIPIVEIPDKIGFIEVDFDKFSLKTSTNKVLEMKGVNITRRATRRIDGRFTDEKYYKEWCREILVDIAYRCSHELLFWRNVIEFS